MNLTGNTILITGGGSGIGRGLAEAFHTLGNQVIIAGRNQAMLEQVASANPGMQAASLDLCDLGAIQDFGARMTVEFPHLNVVINNAGIQRTENLLSPSVKQADIETMVATNLVGPIQLTAALLPGLRKQPCSTLMAVTSGLGFVPIASVPTYCATKAGLHAYMQALRYQLKSTTVDVIEVIPPYVQTNLVVRRMGLEVICMIRLWLNEAIFEDRDFLMFCASVY
jgi:uncharacterized oxidoreductase